MSPGETDQKIDRDSHHGISITKKQNGSKNTSLQALLFLLSFAPHMWSQHKAAQMIMTPRSSSIAEGCHHGFHSMLSAAHCSKPCCLKAEQTLTDLKILREIYDDFLSLNRFATIASAASENCRQLRQLQLHQHYGIPESYQTFDYALDWILFLWHCDIKLFYVTITLINYIIV